MALTQTGEPTGEQNSLPSTVGPSIDSRPSAPSFDARGASFASSIPSRESIGIDGEDGLEWGVGGRLIRVQETNQSYRFPLSLDHIPQVSLSCHEIDQLRERMELAVDRAVWQGGVSWMENPTQSPQNSKHAWKLHLEKKNFIMYRRKTDPLLMRQFLIRAKLDCALNELMYGILNENTEDERTHLAHLYRDDFLDGAVLQVLEGPTIDDPHHLFAIKWMANQSSVDSMYGIRDYLFVEYTKTIEDVTTNSKVIVRILQSIPGEELHVIERPFGFVRNEMVWTQLFRVLPTNGHQKQENKVDFTMSGTIRFPETSNTPAWVGNRYLASMIAVVSGMVASGDAKHIVNQSLITDKPWVPNSERSKCNTCTKSFSFLRSRHHCRICAEIMCSNCTLEVSLRVTNLPVAIRPEGGLISVEKFCYKCVELARKNRVVLLKQNVKAMEAVAIADKLANAVLKGEGSYATNGETKRTVASRRPHNRSMDRKDTQSVPNYTRTTSSSSHQNPTLRRDVSSSVDEHKTPPADAIDVTPLPSSFAKMEESIAVQQALLRSMFIQGTKIHRQTSSQGVPPPAPSSVVYDSENDMDISDLSPNISVPSYVDTID